MTRNEIMAALKSDYNAFAENGLEIFGIFLYGSQNYGLDHEDSDIDVKLIYIPQKSNPEGVLESEMKAYIRDGVSGKVVLVSYMEFLQGLKECLPVYFEILYTDFYIVNCKYRSVWESLQKERTKLIYQNKRLAVDQMLNCLRNLLTEDYTFFFDQKISNKKLALFYRFHYLAKNFLQNVPYEQCLVISNEELRAFLRFLREEQPLELSECHSKGKEVLLDFKVLINSIEQNEIDFSTFEQIKTLFEEAANG